MKQIILPLGIAAVCGSALGACFIDRKRKRNIKGLQDRIYVLTDHFQLLNHWLEVRSEGKSSAAYFEDRGFHHIAIYGMAELANRLFEDLSGSGISIDYGIDQDASCTISRIDAVYSLEDTLPDTDAVIVTPYAAFEDIQESLKKKVRCPVISLEEVVWSV